MRIKSFQLGLLLASLLFVSCICQEKLPQAKHVILIGLDGVGAYGFQRSHTPYMNEMAKNGALSLNSRCVLPSSSSQNWMTMLSGAIPIQHGVTSNGWTPEEHVIEPVLKNKVGFFPSIFDNIKTQKPDDKVYFFYEWGGLGRMFDLSVPDKVVHAKTGEESIKQGMEAFFADKPEFLFVDVDETDHAGHEFGHENQGYFDCVTKYDSIIGRFVERIKKENMLDKVVVIVTGDHGGIYKGHGGQTPNEMETVMLLYGGPVAKGKMMQHSRFIGDIAPTVAGLLGVKMPEECVGSFLTEAFEPASAKWEYAPMPVISPQGGFFNRAVEVSMRTDSPGAKIYYSTDGSEPTAASTLYTKSFLLTEYTNLRAVSISGNAKSKVVSANIRVAGVDDKAAVHYRIFENYKGLIVPDFSRLGKPDREGYVHEFSLTDLDIEDIDHFAIQFSSRLKITEADDYVFTLSSDDGAKVYVDNKLLIDNDGSHSVQTKVGRLNLEKGLHEIQVDYFDDNGGAFLQLLYASGTGAVPKQVVPFSKLK